MKKKYFIILLILFFHLSHAAASENLLSDAQNAYLNNDLEKAQNYYLEIIDSPDFYTAEVYYNLGNISYQLGDLAKALFYYEKAKKIKPRDEDLRANIQFVFEKLPHTNSDVSIINKFLLWNDYLTLTELLFVTGILALGMWLCLYVVTVLKRFGALKPLVVILVLLLISSFSTWQKYSNESLKKWGLILKNQVNVRPNFIETEKTLTTLLAGQKIQVLSQKKLGDNQNWIQIKLPSGQKGWILSDEIGII